MIGGGGIMPPMTDVSKKAHVKYMRSESEEQIHSAGGHVNSKSGVMTAADLIDVETDIG